MFPELVRNGSFVASIGEQISTYVIHDGRDGGRVDGSLRLEGLDVIERRAVEQLQGNGETKNSTIDIDTDNMAQ